MSGTLTSLFANLDSGLFDTFGNQGVVDYKPAYFTVPQSLAAQPQSPWTLEQWGQPVTINPNDYQTNDAGSADTLYGNSLYTWSEPGTTAGLSIYNDTLSSNGGYVYSLSDGGASGESDFFLATPPPLSYGNDNLSHPITVSFDAKVSNASINFAAFQPSLLSYVFATIDVGFTVVFNGAGGIPYGAYTGFVQIDPYVTNSTQPVSFSTGPLTNGANQFTYTKRFASDPSLPLLPSDKNASPDQLTFNVNNYVFNALTLSFANFSPSQQATLLNLSNWSIGSMYIGLATNDIPTSGPNVGGLAASIQSTLQLSNINVGADVSQTYSTSSPVASVPISDSNPQISFYDQTVGDGGLADGGQYTGSGPFQFEYLYNGNDSISLNAPSGADWEFGGGFGATTLTANAMEDLLVASAGGSTMIGGSGVDTFEISLPNVGQSIVTDSISNFHSGDTLLLSGFLAQSPLMSANLYIGTTSANALEILSAGTSIASEPLSIALTGLSSTDLSSLVAFEDTVTGNIALSVATAASASLPLTENVTVASGAAWSPSGLVVSTLLNDGLIQIDPTTLTVENALTGNGQVDIAAGSELNLRGSVSSGQVISFGQGPETLSLADPTQFHGTLFGLSSSDVFDLTSVPYQTNSSAFLEPGNILEVVEPSHTFFFTLNPFSTVDATAFQISSDGLNGTDVSEVPSPCFLAGTMIMTPTGERRVEDLQIGDLILNLRQERLAVKWIGRRSYDYPFPCEADILPIVLKRNALDEGVPNRDLSLSPLHALLIEGYLVPAGSLVNGRLIYRNSEIQKIDYYHIELEQHDVILAQNTPCETFLDFHSRRMFENEHEFIARYPRDTSCVAHQCAPRLEFGPELERLRRKMSLRSGIVPTQSGYAVTGYLDHADRLSISGWAYAPTNPDAPLYVEILDNGAVIATTVANEPRSDLRRALGTHGRHGFSVTLPAPLPALRRHEISVRHKESGQLLMGGPRILDPGVAHDLLRASGFNAIIDAAINGFSNEKDFLELAAILEGSAKRLKSCVLQNSQSVAGARASSQRQPRRTVLVLDGTWPTTSLDAGSNAVISHIEGFLSLGFEVIFCATQGAPKTPAENLGLLHLQNRGIKCVGQYGEVAEEVIRRFARRNRAIVYLHRFASAINYITLAKQVNPNATVVYSVADLHHIRIDRQANVCKRPELARKAREVREAELFAVRVADMIITHSDMEASYLRALLPSAKVHVVTWTAEPAVSVPMRDGRDIAFVGGAGHAPNLDAVKFLSAHVMPEIWLKEPEIRCFVAGADWCKSLTGLMDPRIIFAGHQPNLHSFLGRFSMTVAPLRFGAGIKGKVVDSLAAGVPCVMSPIAGEGMRFDNTLKSCITSLETMSAEVLALIGHKQRQYEVGLSGLRFVQSHFSQLGVNVELRNMFGDPE